MFFLRKLAFDIFSSESLLLGIFVQIVSTFTTYNITFCVILCHLIWNPLIMKFIFIRKIKPANANYNNFQ